MKKITLPLLGVVLSTFTACSTTQHAGKDAQSQNPTMTTTDPQLKDNPLLTRSTLQYQAPDFSKIKDEHFRPAFRYGLDQHWKEVEAIINNPAAPTFENTIVALEKSGEVLNRATTIFGNLKGSNTNPTLQAIDEEFAPVFAAHDDKIYLNDQLYQRIKKVDMSKLQGEDRRLAEVYMQRFQMAGAALDNQEKQQLKKINEELATMSTQFTSKLLEARKKASVVFDSAAELDGLTPDQLAAAQAEAKAAGYSGKYLINIINTTQQPILQNLTNRASREKIFKASWYRAEQNDANDTRQLIADMARLRLKKAQILGKKNFAEWKLQNQMAKTPEAAMDLLAALARPAVGAARQEMTEIRKLAEKDVPGIDFQPWDWTYYAEKLRKEKYDLDENEIKPYFEVNTVLEKGVFYAAEKFYGITFKKRPDLPVYNPDVVAYEVMDRDGKSLALYYLDFYARDNKNGGAWMNNLVDQSHLLAQKPVIVNVFNYQKPAPGKPSLISYDDVSTMFHEFGHTLHGLFADQKYATLSGTSVPRDFVEFPSQINEFFALEPAVLKNYALHYQTKQPMPQQLVDKIKRAENFNQGYGSTEIASAALLDMALHTITNENQLNDVLSFERNTLQKYGLDLPQVPPRYHAPYFSHIWSGGYSAGYYAYSWSDMLNAAAWDYIVKHGGMTRANGDHFRAKILSIGNSKDLAKAYQEYIGAQPTLDPLLRSKGFIK